MSLNKLAQVGRMVCPGDRAQVLSIVDGKLVPEEVCWGISPPWKADRSDLVSVVRMETLAVGKAGWSSMMPAMSRVAVEVRGGGWFRDRWVVADGGTLFLAGFARHTGGFVLVSMPACGEMHHQNRQPAFVARPELWTNGVFSKAAWLAVLQAEPPRPVCFPYDEARMGEE